MQTRRSNRGHYQLLLGKMGRPISRAAGFLLNRIAVNKYRIQRQSASRKLPGIETQGGKTANGDCRPRHTTYCVFDECYHNLLWCRENLTIRVAPSTAARDNLQSIDANGLTTHFTHPHRRLQRNCEDVSHYTTIGSEIQVALLGVPAPFTKFFNCECESRDELAVNKVFVILRLGC